MSLSGRNNWNLTCTHLWAFRWHRFRWHRPLLCPARYLLYKGKGEPNQLHLHLQLHSKLASSPEWRFQDKWSVDTRWNSCSATAPSVQAVPWCLQMCSRKATANLQFTKWHRQSYLPSKPHLFHGANLTPLKNPVCGKNYLETTISVPQFTSPEVSTWARHCQDLVLEPISWDCAWLQNLQNGSNSKLLSHLKHSGLLIRQNLTRIGWWGKHMLSS